MSLQTHIDSPTLPVAILQPRLPLEVCDMILSEMQPRNAWRLRGVSRRWAAYILDTLAPKVWIPAVSLSVRGPQSWIFWPSTDDSAATKFDFVGRGEDGLARFEPRGRPLPTLKSRSVLTKMEEDVEIIWTFPPGDMVKNIETPSLKLENRNKLTLAVDWRELLVRAFAPDPAMHAHTGFGNDRPVLLWTANGDLSQAGVWTTVVPTDSSTTDGEEQPDMQATDEETLSDDALRGGPSGYEADLEDGARTAAGGGTRTD